MASAVTSLQEAVAGLKTAEKDTTGDNTGNTTNDNTDNNTDDASGNITGDDANGSGSSTDNNIQGTVDKTNDVINTGDNALPMVLWFSLGAASLAGLGYIAVTEKKKKVKADK